MLVKIAVVISNLPQDLDTDKFTNSLREAVQQKLEDDPKTANAAARADFLSLDMDA